MEKGKNVKSGWIWLVLALLMFVCAAAQAEENAFQPQDLPVIYLHIDGGKAEIEKMNSSEDHSYRCSGTMDIAVPEGYDGQFGGMYPQENAEGLRIKFIRGRGNGTWGMPKLPYRIKLEEKADLFGMGKSKNWALLANVYDNSHLRNWLTEWLGDEMGLDYTPNGVFVEVVMDGEYLGVYYLSELVGVGKHRVNLDELQPGDTDLPDIQGGYLLDFNPDEWESPNIIETSRGQMFGNNEPSFDPADGGYENENQRNYIRDYIQAAEDAVYSGENYADYLDLKSLADYWWIQEFTVNADAFRTDSAHMFKPRWEADGSEGKLHFGPLWDFDESWGNAQIETIQSKGFNNATFIWADELRKDPEFVSYLKERWQVMDVKLEEIVREGGILDQAAAIIRNGWIRDAERWRDAKAEIGIQTARDLDAEIAHIRQWINLRRAWINENLDKISQLTCVLTVRGEGMKEKTYDIACDIIVDVYDLDVPEVEGRTFKEWTDEDGNPVDFVEMDSDKTLIAQFE